MIGQRDVFWMEGISELCLEVANAEDATEQLASLFQERLYSDMFDVTDYEGLKACLLAAHAHLQHVHERILKRKEAISQLSHLLGRLPHFSRDDINQVEKMIDR